MRREQFALSVLCSLSVLLLPACPVRSSQTFLENLGIELSEDRAFHLVLCSGSGGLVQAEATWTNAPQHLVLRLHEGEHASVRVPLSRPSSSYAANLLIEAPADGVLTFVRVRTDNGLITGFRKEFDLGDARPGYVLEPDGELVASEDWSRSNVVCSE